MSKKKYKTNLHFILTFTTNTDIIVAYYTIICYSVKNKTLMIFAAASSVELFILKVIINYKLQDEYV